MSLLPILPFIKGWVAASTTDINGPYFAGTLNGVKVFVSPSFGKTVVESGVTKAVGEFVVGVKGNDNLSVAGIYAPYMAVVPTQLLQYADGGNSQGFSTLYALEKLNENLVVAGEVK